MQETTLIQPTLLYNLLNQSLQNPYISNANFLLLFDVRGKEDYEDSHIFTAKRLKKTVDGKFTIPYECELPCKWNVIVYDGTTKSLEETSNGDANAAAKFLFKHGSRRAVGVLWGGYELFSREYPFIKSQQIMILPRELEKYEPYPLEVISRFLYLATRKQANNRKMHRELEITAHVNCDVSEDPIYRFCENIENLAFCRKDGDQDFITFLHKACDFLQQRRLEGRRVIVVSMHTISRNVSVAIAYLIKYGGMSLKVSLLIIIKLVHSSKR
ncbi:Serine/threonine/tyrosine-interacting protein 1 [Fasciolopsis buskii]|uniref:Serine/threonine/tyrosine-interacting protein 1 n=1 Tax=Fasciolopsis buskii TaxID=27845 RepID=A0A8E0RXF6_9TREM|nr:Serine/threonine/tyrosine-interacting protein 1 [Fasciolopsis buski]